MPTVCLFPKALCVLLLFSSLAFGFEFRRSVETLAEFGTIITCILEEPKASYAFRPRFDWDARYDEKSHTVIVAPKTNATSWITIRLVNSPAAGVGVYVRAAYPKATLTEQFTLRIASKEAEAADFIDHSTGTLPLKRRLALLQSPSGTFEFLLSSRPQAFDAAEQAFSQLLASFEFRGPPDKTPAAAGQ